MSLFRRLLGRQRPQEPIATRSEVRGRLQAMAEGAARERLAAGAASASAAALTEQQLEAMRQRLPVFADAEARARAVQTASEQMAAYMAQHGRAA